MAQGDELNDRRQSVQELGGGRDGANVLDVLEDHASLHRRRLPEGQHVWPGDGDCRQVELGRISRLGGLAGASELLSRRGDAS
eukprot:6969749-Prymnesium_polylepis.1